MGKPAETARRSLKSLSHSFTLDGVLGFQYREDAKRFLEELQERMGKFGLELHPGENAPDRIRAICHRTTERAWRGKT
jgi:hypothetical protein